MRRTVTAISILIISLFIGIYSYFSVKTTCNQTIALIDEILESAITEDIEKVNLSCVRLNTQWKKKKFLLSVLISKEYPEDVSKHINKMVYFSEIEDTDSVIAAGEDCKAELSNIIQSNEPELSTIF